MLAQFSDWAAEHAKNPRVGTGFRGKQDCFEGECLANLPEPTYYTHFFPARLGAVRFNAPGIPGAYQCGHIGGRLLATKPSGSSVASRCAIGSGKLAGWGAVLFVNADQTTVVTVFTDAYLAANPRFASELPQP